MKKMPSGDQDRSYISAPLCERHICFTRQVSLSSWLLSSPRLLCNGWFSAGIQSSTLPSSPALAKISPKTDDIRSWSYLCRIMLHSMKKREAYLSDTNGQHWLLEYALLESISRLLFLLLHSTRSSIAIVNQISLIIAFVVQHRLDKEMRNTLGRYYPLRLLLNGLYYAVRK